MHKVSALPAALLFPPQDCTRALIRGRPPTPPDPGLRYSMRRIPDRDPLGETLEPSAGHPPWRNRLCARSDSQRVHCDRRAVGPRDHGAPRHDLRHCRSETSWRSRRTQIAINETRHVSHGHFHRGSSRAPLLHSVGIAPLPGTSHRVRFLLPPRDTARPERHALRARDPPGATLEEAHPGSVIPIDCTLGEASTHTHPPFALMVVWPAILGV